MHKSIFILFTSVLIVLLAHFPLAAEEEEVQQFNIKLAETTLEESIAKLSEIYDIEINILGTANFSKHKFNLDLEQAGFEQAIKEVIRKANLQSHALFQDTQKKTAFIWALPAGATDSEVANFHSENEMRAMTQEEYKNLKPAESVSFRGMTPEEYKNLEPAESVSFRGMTPEEYKNLEPAESVSFRGMTPEEYARLKSNLNNDLSETFRGMTQEEYLKLEK